MGVRVECPQSGSPAACLLYNQSPKFLSQVTSTSIPCQRVSRNRKSAGCVGVSAVDGRTSSASEGVRGVPTLQADTIISVNGQQLDLDPEEEEDNRVVTTFRWPAALGGQDVSVVGATHSLNPCPDIPLDVLTMQLSRAP